MRSVRVQDSSTLLKDPAQTVDAERRELRV
jgi:hypothetical protein